MAIFRVHKTKDYTIMSNHHLKDKGLSLKAKGLLSLILSLPDDWNYTTRGLAAICKEGVDSISGALKELEQAGYIVRHRLRDDKGRITDTEYAIYETPREVPEDTPDTEEPDSGIPDTEAPYPENPDTRQIQRVSDKAIGVLPKNEVLRIFPKQVPTSQSSLILKGPKTEDSHRKQYLTTPLLAELRKRLAEIEENKQFFQEEYHDYGLLICQADGRPLDPKNLEKGFKEHQKRLGIPEKERIDFQGLRKSGQMHKVRLSQNNYQLVAENAGQSPEVLMSHYNEALDYEKRALSRLVEGSFYPHQEPKEDGQEGTNLTALMAQIRQNPDLRQKLLQNLLLCADQRA